MRWPWVARSTLDAVVEERGRLRAQNDRLLEHLTRMDRAEHGLSEAPREQKPPLTVMPPQLRAHIEAFGGAALQRMQKAEAYRKHAGGQSWEEVMEDIMGDEREDE